MRYTRFLLVGLLAAAATACDRGDRTAEAQVDPSQLTSSGEVALADGGSMSFNITSERYKQWDQARRGFPKSLITRFGQVLQPRSPTERSINDAVALLEGNAAARQAIEGAGLSVRGFVEITVALEQQMLAASTRGGAPDPMPIQTYPMTMDSGYYPMPMPTPEPYPPVPVTPYPYTPQPVTPIPPVTPAPVLPAPRDTVRRDTIVPTPVPTPIPAPRSDTVPVRRDTTPAPIRRDTVIAPKPQPQDTARPRPDSTRGA